MWQKQTYVPHQQKKKKETEETNSVASLTRKATRG